ncbi:hypothetical protein PMNALOAF_1836 [Methylobacterium adhaesivum]|uniref:DUF4435 domain-containing protein n=1 Tax=Methylobacterium adhaesivum TaxID=333297 RepID=A0ABT8BCL9_9HYPH|nr:DUF4435 domain-containing protein [Methylobacterium adhaesivum]MDN3589574.1 DUF4435 domain-containing protein [Methylobacterium adhaesivum]GJD30589.1 hypothetical protein PMNALOAF_1836 [Methylobacterium adhaesivum]
MLSISKYMDEYDIAQEVRFERQVHKGSILLLEGPTDVKRFAEYLDETECSIANCYGRSKATKAIRLLSEDGFLGALAVLDCDFDRILKRLEIHENIVYSDLHDYDLEWITSNVLKRYLFQVGDVSKCLAIGGSQQIFRRIIEGIKPLSVLKLLNANGNIRFKLSILKMEDFSDGMSIDIDKLVDGVFEGRAADAAVKADLRQKIERILDRNFDLMQLSNGHDVMTALGLALRSAIGSRSIPQTWGKEIELHIRLAFTDDEFVKCSVCRDIVEWERQNAPYIVIDHRIRTKYNLQTASGPAYAVAVPT